MIDQHLEELSFGSPELGIKGIGLPGPELCSAWELPGRLLVCPLAWLKDWGSTAEPSSPLLGPVEHEWSEEDWPPELFL